MDGSIKGAKPNGQFMVIQWGEYSDEAPYFLNFETEADALDYAGKYNTVVKIIKEREL